MFDLQAIKVVNSRKYFEPLLFKKGLFFGFTLSKGQGELIKISNKIIILPF
jgi:hypothetical protein